VEASFAEFFKWVGGADEETGSLGSYDPSAFWCYADYKRLQVSWLILLVRGCSDACRLQEIVVQEVDKSNMCDALCWNRLRPDLGAFIVLPCTWLMTSW
jgi:hypothetical protein